MDFCRTKGAILAELETEGKTYFLQAYLRINDNPESWIGMTDIDQEDILVWANGKTAKYAKWAEGQPRHGQRASICAEMEVEEIVNQSRIDKIRTFYSVFNFCLDHYDHHGLLNQLKSHKN